MDQQPNINPTSTQGPKNTKKIALIILAIVVVIAVAAGIAFAISSSNKKDDSKTASSSNTSNSSNKNNSNASSSKLQKYDVDDPLGAYSVSFYEGATILKKNGLMYLISGEQGSQYSIGLSTVSGTTDCSGHKSTTMTVNGQSSTVCYLEDGTTYAAPIAVKGISMRLGLYGQKAISLEDAKAILESVTFK